MTYIRNSGLWKEFESIYLRNNDSWKEVSKMYERYGASWRLIWQKTLGLLDSSGNELAFPIILSGTTAKELILTSGGDFQAQVVMWGSGAYQSGGYTYGVVQFRKDYKYLLRVNYGGGTGGQGYATPNGGSGGGYAGLFEGSTTSVSATTGQALLIAGGAGGGSGYGTGAGGGGGGTGSNGFDGGGESFLAGAKGSGGTQSTGGSGGATGFSGGAVTVAATKGGNGSSLQGGNGGRCGVYWQNGYDGTSVWTYYGSDGGGAGGGGYYGGGGGGGGGASGNGPSTEFIGYSGGGAGGSGYVNTSKVLGPRGTGGFGGASDPNRGNAGSFSTATVGSENNARVVIRLL